MPPPLSVTDFVIVSVVDATAALRARIAEIFGYLCPDDEAPALVGDSVAEVADSVWRDPSRDRVWLLLCAVAGSFPLDADVLELSRRLTICSRAEAMPAVLEAAAVQASRDGLVGSRIRVVTGRPVVDVDFTARWGHNTGIQRVVRETLSRWTRAGRDFELAAWSVEGRALRSLDRAETERVLEWKSGDRGVEPGSDDPEGTTLLVPWQTTVFLPEVALGRVCDHLAALSRLSGNRIVAIGYDIIPILSIEDVPFFEANRFAKYLTVIKHVDLVLTISESSGEEFAGFADALISQGLRGPEVMAVPLPIDTFAGVPQASEAEDRLPLVLCVGTQEHRKNQVAVLFAAERLWRQALDFELLFVGGKARPLSDDFDEAFAKLAAKGRPITLARGASDEFLLDAYARARFSVFVSRHEGFGLPVGESIAHGTPALTSNYGSVAEVARDGGCVLVDPRDDVAIVEGMRQMLVDDVLIERLRDEIARRPRRTWDDYADQMWTASMTLEARSSR